MPLGEPPWNWFGASACLKVRMVRALGAGSSVAASHSGAGSIAPVVEMLNASSWPLHSLALKRAWYTIDPDCSEVELVATDEAEDTCSTLMKARSSAPSRAPGLVTGKYVSGLPSFPSAPVMLFLLSHSCSRSGLLFVFWSTKPPYFEAYHSGSLSTVAAAEADTVKILAAGASVCLQSLHSLLPLVVVVR